MQFSCSTSRRVQTVPPLRRTNPQLSAQGIHRLTAPVHRVILFLSIRRLQNVVFKNKKPVVSIRDDRCSAVVPLYLMGLHPRER